jgi:hypothetical protein
MIKFIQSRQIIRQIHDGHEATQHSSIARSMMVRTSAVHMRKMFLALFQIANFAILNTSLHQVENLL